MSNGTEALKEKAESKKTLKANKYIKKATLGDIGLKKSVLQELVMANKTGELNIAVFAGRANRAAIEESSFGERTQEYVKFFGDFEAQNLVSGEKYKAGSLILPEIAQGPLALSIAEADFAEFSLIITVRYDETVATSYIFGMKTFGENKPSLIDQLLGSIPDEEFTLIPGNEAPKQKKIGKV